MPKLQRIKRSNGSLVYSINIPLEIIEQLEWKKGEELSLRIESANYKLGIIILKSEDENLNG